MGQLEEMTLPLKVMGLNQSEGNDIYNSAYLVPVTVVSTGCLNS